VQEPQLAWQEHDVSQLSQESCRRKWPRQRLHHDSFSQPQSQEDEQLEQDEQLVSQQSSCLLCLIRLRMRVNQLSCSQLSEQDPHDPHVSQLLQEP